MKRTARRVCVVMTFGFIGCCIALCMCMCAYCILLEQASANMFSASARRFVLETPLELTQVENCLDRDAVLFCDLGERSALKGITYKASSDLKIPMLSGELFSADQSQSDAKLAVVGPAVETMSDGADVCVEIDGGRYRVLGVTGLADLHTPYNYSILVPMRCAYALFEGSEEYAYTVDGPPQAVRKTLDALRAAGVDVDVQKLHGYSLVKLSGGTPLIPYVLLAGLVAVMLLAFAWFEMELQGKTVRAWLTSGATFFQILGRLLQLTWRRMGLPVGIGCLAAWGVCVICLKDTDALALAVTLAVCFLTIAGAAGLSIGQAARSVSKQPIRRTGRTVGGILAVCTVALLVLDNALFIAAQAVMENQYRQSELANHEYRQVINTQAPEEFDAFFREPSALSRSKNAAKMMGMIPNFPYIELIRQPIDMPATVIPADFRAFGDSNRASALQVNEAFFQFAFVPLQQGRYFEAADYVGDDRTIIPVILGAEYSNRYKVGDIISDVEYLFIPADLEVIGILEPGAYTFQNAYSSFPELLDFQIVMPSLIFEQAPDYGSDEWYRQSALYNQKLEGGYFVLSNEKDIALLEPMLKEVAEQCGTYPLTLAGVPDSASSMFSVLSERYVWATVWAAAMASALLCILFVQSAQYLYRFKRQRFRAYKISGASFSQIVLQCAKEPLGLIIGANSAALVLTYAAGGLPYSPWIVAGSWVLGTACIVGALWRTLRKEYPE